MTDHCCAHPKCPGGSLCCCQGQPDPIERAAQAMADDWNPDRDPILTAMFRDYAASAMDSIDTNQLTAIILRTELPGGIKVGHAILIAQAVKDYLTGVEQ